MNMIDGKPEFKGAFVSWSNTNLTHCSLDYEEYTGGISKFL